VWQRKQTLAPLFGGVNQFWVRDVDVSGDTIVAGAPWDAVGGMGNFGAVYVFDRGPGGWVHTAVLTDAEGGSRLFGLRGRLPSAIRRLGMAGVQRLPALKHFFMDEARGMSGTLPSLLQA
jgi:hypothetical protein